MALVNRITASPASLSSRTASLIDPTADCTHPRQPAVGLPPPSLHPDVHGRVAPFVGALTPLPLPCLAVPPAVVLPARLPACPVPAAQVPAGALAPVQPPLVTNYHAAPPVAPPCACAATPPAPVRARPPLSSASGSGVSGSGPAGRPRPSCAAPRPSTRAPVRGVRCARCCRQRLPPARGHRARSPTWCLSGLPDGASQVLPCRAPSHCDTPLPVTGGVANPRRW